MDFLLIWLLQGFFSRIAVYFMKTICFEMIQAGLHFEELK